MICLVNSANTRGVLAHQVDGSVVAFMHAVAAEVGFTLEYHAVSEESVAEVSSRLGSSSSFTACVHEVALGETDLCIGNFWVSLKPTWFHMA